MPVRGFWVRWVGSSGAALALLVGLFGAPDAFGAEAAPKKAPRVTGVDLSASLGGAVRIGDSPTFDVTGRAGGVFGLGLGYVFHPIALGLSYEHMGFGIEETGVGAFGVARVSRALDTVWASMRVRLQGVEPVVPFFGIGLGASFQTATVGGIYLPPGGSSGGVVFGCSARDSMNLALRAVVGAEVPLSGAFSFTGEGSFDAYRLSADVLEGCVPGAGSANAVGVRVGLLYRFDLTESRGATGGATQLR